MNGDILEIPAPAAANLVVRLAPLAARDVFDPPGWPSHAMAAPAGSFGPHTLDLGPLALPDGDYEYEVVVDGAQAAPVADPYATAITRFGGYRGVLTMNGGHRAAPAFSWDDEFPDGMTLPPNEALAIYEVPVRWMDEAADDQDRQVGLGTFDKLLFEQLDNIVALGFNAVELLPVADSPDTVNWGYGSRFLFAPDHDLGGATDLRFLVKQCHRRGVRVILDVVMYFSRSCPLEQLAFDEYYLTKAELGNRNDWGGSVFRYWSSPPPDAGFPAREFMQAMARYWVSEYRVDGFRIDAFTDIDNWDFVQSFTESAAAANAALAPQRPFFVVAEDNRTRAQATRADPGNPNGRPVVGALWNFAYLYDVDRLVRGNVTTTWGQPSRTQRVEALITADRCWDDLAKSFNAGFDTITASVPYLTSHDVQSVPRLMDRLLGDELRARGLFAQLQQQLPGRADWEIVRWVVDMAPQLAAARDAALERVVGAHALLMTSVGLPMVLAGEEFGDVHDLDPNDYRQKMSDPVNWQRRSLPAHAAAQARISDLIRLRTTHPALRRGETEFFYVHPDFDSDAGARVFAYARSGGQPLGGAGQVIVLCNMGAADYPEFVFPQWPWRATAVVEHGAPATGAPLRLSQPSQADATISLAPWQVRVFESR